MSQKLTTEILPKYFLSKLENTLSMKEFYNLYEKLMKNKRFRSWEWSYIESEQLLELYCNVENVYIPIKNVKITD